ncbi:hypothetical protein EPR50_G00067290 [Perca flavescens]|uniref:SRCR domain-containing protein n=1 Tax=Perca flavescens TaxID=8167 RepID=A0A484D9V1_PERFV|nr:hypothetical protein EPR50_G00067290 [Perca flavescens]
MTLILSKTDGLINTGGILTGSRHLQWECTGELDCQGPRLRIPHCEKTTSQGFSPSPGLPVSEVQHCEKDPCSLLGKMVAPGARPAL